MIFPPAPSAAPTSVSVSEVTSSNITIQWGAVNCIHRNGDITGYSVRYGVQGSGSTQTVSVSGGGATMITISELTPSTTYSIEMAAVNSAGTGVYSTPLAAETPESKCAYLHVLWNEMNIYLLTLQMYIYLSLNGENIPNHGYVVISDIGTANDDTALLCNTNHRPTAGSTNSGGNWYIPDGSPVGSNHGVGSADFGRTRGTGLVRLIRNSDATGTPTEGIYSCTVQDNTMTLQTVYVGLYNSGGG